MVATLIWTVDHRRFCAGISVLMFTLKHPER
jgi:hypothetical protein